MSGRLPPRVDALLRVALLLETYIPLDEPLSMVPHTSMKGVNAVRIQGVSWKTSWFVDVYHGDWFYYHVPPFEPESLEGVNSLVVALGAKLKGRYD